MKAQAIIVAAGSGTRLKSKVAKPLVLINGRPLIGYTLRAFEAAKRIDSVILVVPPGQASAFKKIISTNAFSKVKKIVAGGKVRKDSVANGIKALDKDTKIVAIHDGARPLISPKIIDKSVELCKENDAVVAAVPVKATVKRVDSASLKVEATLQREKLWEVQTPQTFRKQVLIAAHRQTEAANPTDDAYLAEQLGVNVKVFMGSYENIKVTTKEDLIIAEAFLCNTK